MLAGDGGQHWMARAYSKDLRDRVVASVAGGRSCRATAKLFGVSVASVVKWSQRFRATGSAAAKPMGGRRPYALAAEREWLLARIAARPDVTLRALVVELADRGITVSYYAVCVFDGPINGRSFRAYVEQVLLPTLQPGDVVILDNLGSHKGQVIRRILRAAGAKLLFLPPYSPDQPDRAGLRQAQNAPAQGRRADRHRHMAAHRPAPQCLHTPGMRKLLPKLRLRFRLKLSCSRAAMASQPIPYLFVQWCRMG
jgi:transposase